MGILSSFLNPPAHAGGWVNKPAGDDYWYIPRGAPSSAGINVDEATALQFSTVFACVSKLSKTVATLPIGVFEKTSEDERRSVSHELNGILDSGATGTANGLTIRETAMAHLLLWGNAYMRLTWSNDRATLLGIENLYPQYMHPYDDGDGGLLYVYWTNSGEMEVIPPEQMWHIRGLSLDGKIGLSVIGMQRETVGHGMAQAKFGATWFGNGVRPGGYIKTGPHKLNKDDFDRIINDLKTGHGGPANAHKVAMLPDGWEFQQVVMPLKDAQFLEARQFQRVEICGIFDVPPSKINDDTRSTFSNVEQKNIDWATDSIGPWCVRIEKSAKQRFFSGTKRYLKHNLAGLVRGDISARYAAYATGRQWGWLSINDIRRMEDMNPVKSGDDYLQPLNMQVVGEKPVETVTPAPQTPPNQKDDSNQDDAAAFLPMAEAAARRITAKECKAIANSFKRRAKENGPNGFQAWLDKFYGQLQSDIIESVAPVVAAWEQAAGRVATMEADRFAGLYCGQSHTDVVTALVGSRVHVLIDQWQREKAETLTKQIMELLHGNQN